MKTFEQRLEAIENRNAKVENDKAWETSWIRRGTVAVLTYIVVIFYLHYVVKISRPFINGLVPVIGYLLSTLAVNFVRHIWEENHRK